MGMDINTFREVLDKFTYNRYDMFRLVPTEKPFYRTPRPRRTLAHIPFSNTLSSRVSLGKTIPLLQKRQMPARSFLDRLSDVFHYTYRITRYNPEGPYHFRRPVPSPRTVFPNDLYVAIRAADVWDVFYYCPQSHCLRLVSSMNSIHISSIFNHAIKITDDAFIFVVFDIWRLAQYYSDFAINLACLEAGHIVGQMNLVACRFSFELTTFYHFSDTAVLDNLGLSATEYVPMAIIGLRSQNSLPNFTNELIQNRSSQDGDGAISYEDEVMQLTDICRLRTYNQNVLVEHPELFGVIRKPELEAGFPNVPMSFELNHAIRRRHSANAQVGASSLSSSIQAVNFFEMFNEIQAYSSAMQLNSYLRLYVHITGLQGYKDGIYQIPLAKLRTDPACRMGFLRPKSEYNFESFVHHSQRDLNTSSIPLSFIFVANFEAAFAIFGSRAFHLLNIQVGELAQGICILCGDRDLFARPLRDTNELYVEDVLGFSQPTSWRVAYQIVAGNSTFRDFSLCIGGGTK